DAQALSASTSSGHTGFVIMFAPLVDGALLRPNASRRGGVGGARGGRDGAVIGDGSGERRLVAAIELLELARLLAPVAGLPLLDQKERGETQRDDDAGDALGAKQAEDHGRGSHSASTEAPSRPAE